MKRKYEDLEINILYSEMADILTSSGDIEDGAGDFVGNGNDNVLEDW